jgi:hypothetical protein
MKTPAIIASLTVVGSIAYATGSQGTAGKQPPLMPSGSQPHSMQEEMPQTRMQMAGGCTEGEPLTWFGAVREAPECLMTDQNIFTIAADINGDGEIEYFSHGDWDDWHRIWFFNGSTPIDVSVLILNQTTGSGDQIAVVNRRACGINELLGFAQSKMPGLSRACAVPGGWRDIDHDGDQDLMLTLYLESESSGRWVVVWLENIGFQHSNPIAADLNHDNRVDGADLSLLLVSWGQTQ